MDATQNANGDRAGPYLLPPGEVRRHLTSWPGATTGVRAGSRDTAGLLAVLEGTLAPWAPGPPLHLHTSDDEMLYVLEGTLLVQIGEERHELGAGGFAWIPRNTPHTFANAAGTPLRGLTLAVPGGLEELLAEQGEYLGQLRGAPNPAELGRIGARHGSRLLGAPVTAPGAPATPDG